jgi:hypothetical protein
MEALKFRLDGARCQRAIGQARKAGGDGSLGLLGCSRCQQILDARRACDWQKRLQGIRLVEGMGPALPLHRGDEGRLFGVLRPREPLVA